MEDTQFQFRSGSTSSSDIGPDLLGHEPLARNLAKSLCGQAEESAQVIGLCGEWGSGKSWVIYRVREILKQTAPHSTPRCPVWLEFNPWQWHGTEAIISEFFAALGDAVDQVEPKAKKPWYKIQSTEWTQLQFREYSARLSAHSVVIGGYSQLVAGSTGLVALLAAAELIVDPDWLSGLTVAVAASVTFLSGFVKLVSDFFSKMSEAKQAQEERFKKSPQKIKADLVSKMKTLPRPIAVVLDDLDRLTADEISVVFQLVKAQADFPNVYYLLAFDRQIIETSLERIAPGVPGNGLPLGRGRHFLEKVVPVIFDLPVANSQVIENILRDEIQKVPGVTLREAEADWSDWWANCLSTFFGNLRDVERFLNGVHFNVSLLTEGEGELEVDALDFIGVETLRLFEPLIYQLIAHNREAFTQHRPFADIYIQKRHAHIVPPRDVEGERRQSLNAIVDMAQEKEATRQLLRRLFPTTEELLRKEGEGALNSARQGMGSAPNVAESAFFNRFFRLAVGPEEWSQREARDLSKAASNRTEFLKQWHGILEGEVRPRSSREIPPDESPQARDDGSRERLRELTELLYRQIRNLPSPQSPEECATIQNLATVLLNAGDMLPTNWGGRWISGSVEEELSDLVFAALCRIQDPAQRRQTTLAALRDTQGWALKAWFVLRENQRHGSGERDFHLKSNQLCLALEDAEVAFKQCLTQIEVAAATGELWKRPRAKNWIYLWRDWGDADAQKRLNLALGRILETNAGVYGFLQSFLSTLHTSSLGGNDRQVHRSWVIDPVELQRFVPLGRLEAALWILELELEKEIRAEAQGLVTGKLTPQQLNPALRRRWICLNVCVFAFERHNSGFRSMIGWEKSEAVLDAELEELLSRCQKLDS
jgi:hypothetical protein